jgi:hypothetical protein
MRVIEMRFGYSEVNPLPLRQPVLGEMMMCSKSGIRWHRVLVQAVFASCVMISLSVEAGDPERQQAKRIYDRLAGVPPTNAIIDQMEILLLDNKAVEAADLAMEDPSFYNVTLKNFAAPWTNEAQDVFVPLNDYSATVIGLIRDNADFREVLYGNVLYHWVGGGVTAYSGSNNLHYAEVEAAAKNLKDTGSFVRRTQTLPDAATAGVMTTRAAGEAFFSGGTNRAMLRFTLMNHLCTDLEPLKDVTRTPDRVRRDVSRSPGGDSSVFLNSCVGCHAGMDGLAGAFAYYEYDEATGAVQYRAVNDKFDSNGVSLKHNINATNFPYGHVTTNDSWINYWRNGQNKLLGWDPGATRDENLHVSGNGAKSLGIELANSTAFSTCQVKKVFKAVCFRDPGDYAADRTRVDAIATEFRSDSYNMKNVFAKVAAYCKGP